MMAGLLRSEQGASAVEVALLMPLLLLFAFGLVDIGRAVFGHLAIEEAAQEGAAFAAYHGDDLGDSSTDIVDAVRLATDSVQIDAADVAVVCAAKTTGEQLITFPTAVVTITGSIDPVTPLVSNWFPTGIPIRASASQTVFTGSCLATP